MKFKDHFSDRAALYATCRPLYPDSLFTHLAAFPFDEVALPPQHQPEARWTLAELAGYLRTWSSTARYTARHGLDPVIEVEQTLSRDWGDPEKRRVIRWPVHLRAGRVRA